MLSMGLPTERIKQRELCFFMSVTQGRKKGMKLIQNRPESMPGSKKKETRKETKKGRRDKALFVSWLSHIEGRMEGRRKRERKSR